MTSVLFSFDYLDKLSIKDLWVLSYKSRLLGWFLFQFVTMQFFIMFVLVFLSTMVSSGFNFASYKSAFGNTPQAEKDKEVSPKTEDDLALNSMMDHGIENQAISNVVQVRDH